MSWSSGPARRMGARDKARNSMVLGWNGIPPGTGATGFGSASLRSESERRPNALVRVGPRSTETRLIVTRGNCQWVLVVLASARPRGSERCESRPKLSFPSPPQEETDHDASSSRDRARCSSSSSLLVSRAAGAARTRSGAPPGSRWGKISLLAFVRVSISYIFGAAAYRVAAWTHIKNCGQRSNRLPPFCRRSFFMPSKSTTQFIAGKTHSFMVGRVRYESQGQPILASVMLRDQAALVERY